MNRAPIVTDIPDPFTNFAFFNYALPDNYLTLVSSWQCLPSVVTVGNYTNRMSWVDYNSTSQTQTSCGYTPVTPGKIGPSSSLGPTRTGYQKPDITASGDFTFTTSRLASATSLISSNPCKVAQGGMHNFNGGTSMSSPVVAGFAALYLQKYPNADYQDFLNHIKVTAKNDIHTGGVPNNSWGYGKLDGFLALQQNFVNNNNSIINENIKIFPNPSNGEINVLIKNIKEREIIINIYNNFGQLIYNDKIYNAQSMISKNISLSDISKGVYYFEAIGNSIHKKSSFVID
jgi:subtilisin family serine protease